MSNFISNINLTKTEFSLFILSIVLLIILFYIFYRFVRYIYKKFNKKLNIVNGKIINIKYNNITFEAKINNKIYKDTIYYSSVDNLKLNDNLELYYWENAVMFYTDTPYFFSPIYKESNKKSYKSSKPLIDGWFVAICMFMIYFWLFPFYLTVSYFIKYILIILGYNKLAQNIL